MGCCHCRKELWGDTICFPFVKDGPVCPMLKDGPVYPMLKDGPVYTMLKDGPVYTMLKDGRVPYAKGVTKGSTETLFPSI